MRINSVSAYRHNNPKTNIEQSKNNTGSIRPQPNLPAFGHRATRIIANGVVLNTFEKLHPEVKKLIANAAGKLEKIANSGPHPVNIDFSSQWGPNDHLGIEITRKLTKKDKVLTFLSNLVKTRPNFHLSDPFDHHIISRLILPSIERERAHHISIDDLIKHPVQRGTTENHLLKKVEKMVNDYHATFKIYEDSLIAKEGKSSLPKGNGARIRAVEKHYNKTEIEFRNYMGFSDERLVIFDPIEAIGDAFDNLGQKLQNLTKRQSK